MFPNAPPVPAPKKNKIFPAPIPRTKVTNAALVSSIEISNAISGLFTINNPRKELVICHRSIPSNCANWLEKLNSSDLPDFRLLVSPVDSREAITTELDQCEIAANTPREWFISDIVDLVFIFSQITKTDLIDIRLDRIDRNACWKFHRDSVETRLLTTYLGQGTEWLRPQYAEKALQDQQNYTGPLESLSNNDIAIFKGSRSGIANGIVHRSPPIEGTGGVRLLLCLNTQSIVSPEPWRSIH